MNKKWQHFIAMQAKTPTKWNYNVEMYLNTEADTIFTDITVDEKTFIRFKLFYRNAYEANGKWVGYEPTLNVCKMHRHGENTFVSYGTGRHFNIATPTATKSFATLCNIAKDLDARNKLQELTETIGKTLK